MGNYFHVSPVQLTVGQVLEPGSWGRAWRTYGMAGGLDPRAGNNATIMVWEIALETARVVHAPDAPSRLDCNFATLRTADAEAFRDQFRQGGHIYEVSCVEGIPTHAGNYDAITNARRDGTPWLNYMPQYAFSYWRDQPTGIHEIIIGGPVTVVREVGVA